MVHSLIAAPVFLFAWLGFDPGPTLLLGAILVLIGYPIVAVLEMRLTPLVLGPLSYYFAWQWLILGVAGLWKGIDVLSGTTWFPFSTAMVSSEDLASGYALYLLGLLAFHYGATMLRPVTGPGSALRQVQLPGTTYRVLWFVGIMARVLRTPLAWMGGALGVLSSASSAALCAIAVRGEPGLRLSKFSWLLLLAGMAVEFILGVLGNSKGLAMLSLIPIAWLALRSRRPARSLAALVVVFAALYGGVVYPLVTVARNSGELDTTAGGYSPGAVLRAKDEVSSASVDWSRTADEFLDRIFVPTPVGFLVSQVRASGLRSGETMDYLQYALIPRIVWSDKPVVTRGRWFDAYIGGSSDSDQPGTSLGQTAAGELFWNFGILGVIVGMLISGLVFGWLWKLATADPRNNPIKMLLYVNLLLAAPGMMETEWGTGFVGLLFRVALFWPLLRTGTQGHQAARALGHAP